MVLEWCRRSGRAVASEGILAEGRFGAGQRSVGGDVIRAVGANPAAGCGGHARGGAKNEPASSDSSRATSPRSFWGFPSRKSLRATRPSLARAEIDEPVMAWRRAAGTASFELDVNASKGGSHHGVLVAVDWLVGS